MNIQIYFNNKFIELSSNDIQNSQNQAIKKSYLLNDNKLNFNKIIDEFLFDPSNDNIKIVSSDIASIYVHGSQEKIGNLFKDAREKAPTILFRVTVTVDTSSSSPVVSKSVASVVPAPACNLVSVISPRFPVPTLKVAEGFWPYVRIILSTT